MALTTNQIKEIAPGIYSALLWCPDSSLLHNLLDRRVSYVLCWDHDVGSSTWQETHLPILSPTEPLRAYARTLSFDFVLPTTRFLEILPCMRPAMKAVQLDRFPPDYLDMKRIKGKQLFRILDECNWHVLLDTPANDYGQVMSPKRLVIEHAIEVVAKNQS